MQAFDFDSAIVMHRSWKMRLHPAIVWFAALAEGIETLLVQLESEIRKAGLGAPCAFHARHFTNHNRNCHSIHRE